jgi:hypothetical protein
MAPYISSHNLPHGFMVHAQPSLQHIMRRFIRELNDLNDQASCSCLLTSLSRMFLTFTKKVTVHIHFSFFQGLQDLLRYARSSDKGMHAFPPHLKLISFVSVQILVVINIHSGSSAGSGWLMYLYQHKYPIFIPPESCRSNIW